VTVVLMDWFVFGTMTPDPAPAAASTAARPALAPTPNAKPAPVADRQQAAPAVIQTRALAARLTRVAQAHGADPDAVRDAFTPSEAWVPREAPQQREAPADEALKQKLSDFAAAHKLLAVLASGARPLAVVKSALGQHHLTLDDQLNGFRLVQIGDRFAVFEHEGRRVELRLPGGQEE
jgi:hypothetical protein